MAESAIDRAIAGIADGTPVDWGDLESGELSDWVARPSSSGSKLEVRREEAFVLAHEELPP